MCQGQAISVLCRAYHVTGEARFLKAATAALAPFKRDSKTEGGVRASFMNRLVINSVVVPNTHSFRQLCGFGLIVSGFRIRIHGPKWMRIQCGNIFPQGVSRFGKLFWCNVVQTPTHDEKFPKTKNKGELKKNWNLLNRNTLPKRDISLKRSQFKHHEFVNLKKFYNTKLMLYFFYCIQLNSCAQIGLVRGVPDEPFYLHPERVHVQPHWALRPVENQSSQLNCWKAVSQVSLVFNVLQRIFSLSMSHFVFISFLNLKWMCFTPQHPWF